MRSFLYSCWDGSQESFSLEARRTLDALSDLMMEGLDAAEALGWMRRHGFEMAGLDMRVMGLDELLDELRDETESLYQRYRMDEATDELRQRLERILDRELETLRATRGYESQGMNDFLGRRHADAASLPHAIEHFRDYEFEDEQAGREFEELLAELDRLRALTDFLQQHGSRFRGQESADYETAQQVRERIEALEQLARELAQGDFERISLGSLRELLGDQAARSFVLLRDLESNLESAGYLRGGDVPELTPRAIRRIGSQALAEVYGALRKDRTGGHDVDVRGAALPRADETRPFEFGDPLDLDVVRTLLNSVRRNGGGIPFQLDVQDFELRERDFATQTTTVLLLDMSWSMSWAGRFPAAKRVALALDHMIRTRFPRDAFFVVGFSTRARQLEIRDLPEVRWDMGDPFTNLQDGLRVAERLIARHPSASPQVLVITDGQPTAYFADQQLRVEWPMGFGGVSPHAVAATMKEVRRITRLGITINTFMLDDAPELVGFVERMTQINRGRALYSHPSQLGSYVMVDYLRGRRKRQS